MSCPECTCPLCLCARASASREAYLAEHPNERSVYDASPPDPLIAARQRLGAWLAAEQCRQWYANLSSTGGLVTVVLSRGLYVPHAAIGTAPTLAAAIMAALEKIGG